MRNNGTGLFRRIVAPFTGGVSDHEQLGRADILCKALPQEAIILPGQTNAIIVAQAPAKCDGVGACEASNGKY